MGVTRVYWKVSESLLSCFICLWRIMASWLPPSKSPMVALMENSQNLMRKSLWKTTAGISNAELTTTFLGCPFCTKLTFLWHQTFTFLECSFHTVAQPSALILFWDWVSVSIYQNPCPLSCLGVWAEQLTRNPESPVFTSPRAYNVIKAARNRNQIWVAAVYSSL